MQLYHYNKRENHKPLSLTKAELNHVEHESCKSVVEIFVWIRKV
jgi:hypothetical protein